MRQLELDFDAIPGVVQISPYLIRSKPAHHQRSASADIMAFPLSRQRSTIQDVALRFKLLRGKKRQAFWKETITELREGLQVIGMSDGAIRSQLLAFRDAVESELYPDQRDPRYGGAA